MMITAKAMAERDIDNKITVLGRLEEEGLLCYRCIDPKNNDDMIVTCTVGESCVRCTGRTHPGGDAVGTEGGWTYLSSVEAMSRATQSDGVVFVATVIIGAHKDMESDRVFAVLEEAVEKLQDDPDFDFYDAPTPTIEVKRG